MSEVFGGDRDLLIGELTEQEHHIARELASVRQLLHLALEQAHEKGRQLERLRARHHRLRDEYRRLRAGQRAA